MKSFKTVINESSLGRVHQHTKNSNLGMITAFRNSSEHSPEENKARNAELASDIRKHGLGFVHVKGRYVENHGTANAKPVDEHSYLVVGKKGNDNGHLLGVLKKLGKKYNQDSILHKPHDSEHASLHGTNSTGYPGLGKAESVGKWHPNRAGEFHTVMRNGKKFAFGEAVENDFICESFKLTTPITFSSRLEQEC